LLDEIRKTASLVKGVLVEYPQARNSDMFLYLKVCEIVNPEALKMPLCDVLPSLKHYGLPNIETVRRTRQKLQETHPELQSSVKVNKYKMKKEEAFREYAREG